MDDNQTLEAWYEGLTARETELFRRGSRLLISRTFLMKSREREMFGFFARNTEHMEAYFAPMGFTMFLEPDYGIIMLRDRQEAKVDSRELPAVNKKNFSIRESVIYCALAWLFMERMGSGLDRSIMIRPQELTRTLEQFGIGAGFRTEYNKTQISETLKTLQKFSLIDVKGDFGDEECVLVLYPTLLFGLDLKAMEEFLNEKQQSYLDYYRREPEDPDEEEIEEETAEEEDGEPDE